MNGIKKLNVTAIRAHQNQDISALAEIYQAYGHSRIEQNDIESGCFYLSNAYAFALEAGLETAPEIRKLLMHYGREE